jgi:hypothetical protein
MTFEAFCQAQTARIRKRLAQSDQRLRRRLRDPAFRVADGEIEPTALSDETTCDNTIIITRK